MDHPDIRLGIYKHFKGMNVQVIAVGRHTETEDRLAIYIPLDADLKNRKGPMVSVRPLDMFLGQVEKDGKMVNRFEYVGHTLS